MRIERIKIRSLCILSLMFTLWGCIQEELTGPATPAIPGDSGGSGHELAEGERCNVSLSVTGMPSIEEAATRAITPDKMFQDGSKFRMLVFKGPYGGAVNMDTPVANMVCQVNGSSAEFLSPSTTLGLLKGRYTFICFPADEKFNTWKVGEPREKSKVLVSNDDDFVYCKVEDKDMNTSSFSLSLNFARKCYKLTVKLLVAEALGYIVGVDTVPITVGNPVGVSYPIVSSATCDLASGSMSEYKNELIESRIPVQDRAIPQSFGSVDNMLIAPATGSTSKLRIGYPQMTVLKPKGTDGSVNDSVFTIRAGFITTEDAFTFEANKSYTITLSIGEQVKGIMVGGVIWATGNLVYNTNNKYEIAPTPDKAKNAREVRGDWFRWCATLPQSSSNKTTANPTTTKWTVTVPNWSGDANKLGNYDYYKDKYPNNKPSASPGVSELGDPCKGLGGKWRMPTYNEIYLLGYVAGSANPSGTFDDAPRDHLENFVVYTGSWSDNLTGNEKWTGIYITGGSKPNENPAKISSTSLYRAGKHLFLPAAGYSDGSSILSTGSAGTYWGSTPDSGASSYSWYASFNSGRLYPGSYNRYSGFSVRCVLGD